MSAVLNFDTALIAHVCAECGITWAQPNDFTRARRQDGKSFYCPNGHSLSFKETDADRVRREMQTKLDARERELKWVEQSRDAYRSRAEKTERKLTATKGVLTRTKNRIAKGVCPCCKRSFADLHRHMTTKHPDFANPEPDASADPTAR